MGFGMSTPSEASSEVFIPAAVCYFCVLWILSLLVFDDFSSLLQNDEPFLSTSPK